MFRSKFLLAGFVALLFVGSAVVALETVNATSNGASSLERACQLGMIRGCDTGNTL